MLLTWISQATFLVLTVLCLIYDQLLLVSVLRKRFTNKSYPYVYITYMVVIGVYGKPACLSMIDAWPIANFIDPVNGYDTYRNVIGKPMTLAGTHSYLTPVCLNFLMTINRVWVVLKPFDVRMFSDFRLFIYCGVVWTTVFISLLIPLLSSCNLNFDGRILSFVAACAPDRHPITLFQNKYSIYVPIISMITNFTIILYIKWRRRRDTTSSLQKDRENGMLRQAAAIACYLSVYELTNLYVRWYPNDYAKIPEEIRYSIYCVRIFSMCSLNFFVYFIVTKSTRQLVIQLLGLKWTANSRQVIVNISSTLAQSH